MCVCVTRQTALYGACQAGAKEAVRVLLMEGMATPALADHQGETAMGVRDADDDSSVCNMYLSI